MMSKPKPDRIIVTEKDLREQVRDLCKIYGWMMYFSWTSMHSPKGFPDLVLVNADKGRVLFAELKSDKGQVSAEQQYCLRSLALCGQEVHVWRPGDIEEIARVLQQNRLSSVWRRSVSDG